MRFPSQKRARLADSTHLVRARVLRALLRSEGHVALFFELDGNLAYASPSVQRLLGYQPDELLGTSLVALLHPEDDAAAGALLAAEEPEEDPRVFGVRDRASELRLRHRDGRYVTVEALGSDFTSTPDIDGTLLVLRDVSAHRAADDVLRSLAAGGVGRTSLVRLAELADQSGAELTSAVLVAEEPRLWVTSQLPDPLLAETSQRGPWDIQPSTSELVILADLDTRAHPALDPALAAEARKLGFVACWCTPVLMPEQRTPDAAATFGTSSRLALGWIVTWSRRYRWPSPAIETGLRHCADVARLALARRGSEGRLRHLALHDPLTDAYNRAGFEDAIGALQRPDGHLLLIDLDDFKQVNDTFGHAVGDDALVEAARRIRLALPRRAILARYGGDEFAAFIPSVGPEQAAECAAQVLATLRAPGSDGVFPLILTASIGIDSPARAATLRERFASADRALYAAKAGGRQRFVVDAAAAALPFTR